MDVKELPLVSIVLLTYNQEKFIGEALDGVASQDYPNLEIIISDDNSNDNTRNIIEEFRRNYYGHHKVIYNYNHENLGLVRHFNKVMSIVNGEFVVLAAGDDVPLQNRTSLSVRKIRKAGVDSLALNFMYIDGVGNDMHKYAFDVSDELEIFNLSDYINGQVPKPSGPSRIITKKLFDFFGPFRDDCPTEDSTLTFRSLLMGGIAHYGGVGVKYRWHGKNISVPDNLYRKIDSTKIYDQYYKDLRLAKDRKIIDATEFKLIKKIIVDYKITQSLIRKLYIERNRYKRHILGLLYVLNPRVLNTHKQSNFLRHLCEDLFIFYDKIRRVVGK